MFICVAGQSNAVSWGTNTAPFPGGWPLDSGIKIYDPVSGGFVVYVPGASAGGVGTGEVYPTTWGVEAQFALNMRTSNPNEPIYIYKQAHNGVGLAPKPATALDWSPYSSGKCFSQMMTNLQVCMPLVPTTKIDFFLWVGNETDALLQADADRCQHNLVLFINAIRDRVCTPDMKVIISQILNPALYPATFPYPCAGTVRAHQQTLVNWPKVKVFDGGIVPTLPSFHYSPDGVVMLGNYFFDFAKQ